MQTIKDFVLERVNKVEGIDMTEEIMGEITDQVKSTYGVKCNYFHAGSFDSVGYDCDYYVIVFENENGELEGVDAQVESY